LDEPELRRLERWLRFETTRLPFPREVGRYREIVWSFDEFLEWFEKSRQSEDCWSSVYSTDQINKSCYDTLFLDFDFSRGKFNMSLALLKELVNILRELFPRVRLYWTGKKGCHLYLDFGKEVFFYNFREAARQFVNNFVVNYLMPDRQTVGDVRRVARVVGNVRETGQRMIELDSSEDVIEWMRAIDRGRDADLTDDWEWKNERGVNMLIEIDEDLTSTAQKIVEERILSRPTLEKIPPCVVRCFTELVETNELDHQGRLLLANWLLWAGYSEDEVVDVFRVARDFKEHYTRYQVSFLARKKYKLPACKKIMADGFCPYKCEFYPWIHGVSK